MGESNYKLSSSQVAYLEASRHSPTREDSPFPRRIRFSGALPKVSDQSVRGTCVASAVAALVEIFEGCRRRVSRQYLDEVTRLVEHAWVERNIRQIIAGEAVDKDFESAFPEAVSQAMLLVRVNGAESEAATAFVRSLGMKIRKRIEDDAGCRLKHCFAALEQYGVCRDELWPYSPIALKTGLSGGDAVGTFPPGTHEDARRHRIVNGLYLLRSPNNVGEIKGILAGAHGQRPMAVCVGLELFEGLTDGEFKLPEVVKDGDSASVAQHPLGIHEVLIIGYEDDAKYPGGGYFTFLNSWGTNWGEGGKGRVSYAYVACFCQEAGTILLDNADYVPAGKAVESDFVVTRRRRTIICAVALCLGAAMASIGFSIWSAKMSRQPLPPPPPMRAHNPVERPQRPRAARQVVAETDDESFSVERIVDYRFRLRGECDSLREAHELRRRLLGNHRDFSFESPSIPDGKRYFEGVATIEGPAGHPPDAVSVLTDYLRRKNCTLSVRKWSVHLLR